MLGPDGKALAHFQRLLFGLRGRRANLRLNAEKL